MRRRYSVYQGAVSVCIDQHVGLEKIGYAIMFPRRGHWWISDFEILKYRNRLHRHGTCLMNYLIRWTRGTTLRLYADPGDRRFNRDDLIRWYGRFGFQVEHGSGYLVRPESGAL